MLNVPFFWQPDCRLLHCAIAGYPQNPPFHKTRPFPLESTPQILEISHSHSPFPWKLTVDHRIPIFSYVYIYIYIFSLSEQTIYWSIPHITPSHTQLHCHYNHVVAYVSHFPLDPIISHYIPSYPFISHYIPIAVTCQTLMIICLIWSISRLHPHSFPSIFHVLLTCCYPTVQQYIMAFPIKFPLYHPISHYISIVSRLYIYIYIFRLSSQLIYPLLTMPFPYSYDIPMISRWYFYIKYLYLSILSLRQWCIRQWYRLATSPRASTGIAPAAPRPRPSQQRRRQRRRWATRRASNGPVPRPLWSFLARREKT